MVWYPFKLLPRELVNIKKLLAVFCGEGCAMRNEGISLPRSGIESMLSAVEVWSPNHWTSREVPGVSDTKSIYHFNAWL